MLRCLRLAPVFLLLIVGGVVRAEEEAPRRLIGRVHVRGDGFVQVSAENLAGLGVVSRDRVRIERGGVPVPLCTSVPGDDVVFLALDTAGPHTATAVYEIVQQEPSAAPPPCPQSVAVASDASPSDAALHAVRVHAEDRVHGPVGGGCPAIYEGSTPTWFLERLEHEGEVRHELDGRGAQGPQTIRVRIHGSYLGPIAVAARWGEAALGLAKAEEAAGGVTLTWRVPPAALPRTAAPLVLTNRSPPLPAGPANDHSIGRGQLWIDAIVLEGARIAAMDETLCACELGEKRALWVRGPKDAAAARRDGSLLILDADGRTAASVVLPAEGPVGPWLRIEPAAWPEGGRLVTCATARRIRVTPAQARPDPLQSALAARHVIIAVPALLEGARALAAHRSRNGLPSVAVDVLDVYATYGHGAQTPGAIRDFVRRLRERDVPLEYLLLAGDAIHDRTDWSSRATIPAPMVVRTLWNGATPCDAVYVDDVGRAESAGIPVGRLPFRKAGSMQRYVARLIEHETRPPVDAHRRLLRFLAGGGGMGDQVERMLEMGFRMVLGQALDPAFEVEVTYASAASSYYWPMSAMNDKVVADINRGCLIYTYVGHGTSHESDMRLAWDGDLGIFTHHDVHEVDIRGPRPLMLALASSSAAFDLPKREGLGEALLKRPGGPLAYWGATRYCNPVFNVLVAWGLAMHAGRVGRVGDLLRRARAELHTEDSNWFRALVFAKAQASWPDLPKEALLREGTASYALLGDPALQLSLPRRDITLEGTRTGNEVVVTVKCALPAGTTLHVHLSRALSDRSGEPKAAERPDDPDSFEKVRAVHRTANDRVLVRATVRLENGAGRVTLRLPEGSVRKGMVVTAHAVTAKDVHHGVLVLK